MSSIFIFVDDSNPEKFVTLFKVMSSLILSPVAIIRANTSQRVRKSANMNQTLIHYLVCEHFCLSHSEIFICNGGYLLTMK